MTRRTQPVDLGPPPPPELADAPPDAPSLPVLCDNVSRAGRGIASRLDRAATDLTGGDATGLGRQDVWRFEVEIARAIIELRGLAAGAAAWRHQRDVEVARAHQPDA